MLRQSAGGALSAEHKSGKLRMPADWSAALGQEFRGSVRFMRSFGKPSGLLAGDSVLLLIRGVIGRAEVSLNDAHLGVIPDNVTTPFEVGALLQTRNELSIEIVQPSADHPPGGLIGEIWLEIRPGE